MKISIVTPAYNQAPLLEDTIKSVWSQQGDFDLEHIIADGGSKDGSRAVLEQYDHLYQSGAFPLRCKSFSFKWWSKPDTGQSQAINLGFEVSKGSILGWLNSDDTYFTSDVLHKVQTAFRKSEADIIVGNAHPVDVHGALLNRRLYNNTLDSGQLQPNLVNLRKNNFLLQPACFFRKSVWEKYRLDESLHFLMDWDFWLRAYYGGGRFHKTNDYYATCRIHAGAKTVRAGRSKYTEGLAMFRKYNTWSLNRFYYYAYHFLLLFEAHPQLARPAGWIIERGKNLRNLLVNRMRLY